MKQRTRMQKKVAVRVGRSSLYNNVIVSVDKTFDQIQAQKKAKQAAKFDNVWSQLCSEVNG